MKKEENEANKYGSITIGYGKPEQHDVPISDFLRSTFPDNRFISVIKLENGAYVITVENLLSSGREPINKMYLSEESFIALLSTSMIYFLSKNIALDELLKQLIGDKKEINYSCSDNIKPPFTK